MTDTLQRDDRARFRGRLVRIDLVIGDRARVEYLEGEWDYEWLPLDALKPERTDDE